MKLNFISFKEYTFKNLFCFYLLVYICVRMWVCAHVCRYLWWPAISGLPRAGVLGVGSPLTWVLGTNSV